MKHLIAKYSQAGPRYTSYPPVPFWKGDITPEQWKQNLTNAAWHELDNGISLYIHLPYCESLCTYCGCNTRITTNHSVEIPYIESVLKEWELYRKILPTKTKISELHLGGGTPTFFSASNLHHLITNILKDLTIVENPEFSIEGHPNSTTVNQLITLANLGFRRISYGIQDFDKVVQKAIHRFQTFEQVERVTSLSRQNGFESVNYDLIYGLPFQSTESIIRTFEQVLKLKPDRIAFYGYAHVPWVKPGQRSYSEMDLPSPELRLEMYETGRMLLEDAGYYEIGMDHFALKSDSLYKSLINGKLNRNFMGYTDSQSKVTIGLGVSSISDTGDCFAQNLKTVEEYQAQIEAGVLPVFRGHFLTEEQKQIRKHIKNLMCNFYSEFYGKDESILIDNYPQLKEMETDGIIQFSKNSITVTETGRRFVRNICMAIDPMIGSETKNVFSKTI